MAGKLKSAEMMRVIETVMLQRWDWGTVDCCTSSSDVFRCFTGIDPMKQLRGKYSTAIGAYKIIGEWGGFLNMAEQLAEINGLKPGKGEAGEIGVSTEGVTDGPFKRALLICFEPGVWFGKTENGYAVLPNAERSWNA